MPGNRTLLKNNENEKKNLSKKVKVWGLISLVWLLIIYSATMTGSAYSRDTGAFIWLALIPLVIAWGIYFIKK